MKSKYLLLIIIYLSLIVLSKKSETDTDDSDLVIDDDNDDSLEKKQDKSKTRTKSKHAAIDDMDEFDDPELLRRHEARIEHEKEIKKNPNVKYQTSTPTDKPKEAQKTFDKKADNNYLKDNKYANALFKRYDILLALIFGAFVLNAFIGSRINRAIANLWLSKNQKFFEDNYAHLGFEREYNTKNQNLLFADSYNKFKFFASGRIYTNYLLVFIDLKKRQDLLTTMSSIFLFPEKDHIQYHSALLPNEEVPVIFLICKSKNAKNLQKQYEEIGEFTDEMTLSCINNRKLRLFSENEEFIERMFKNNMILEQYKKVEDYIEMIFYSDRKSFSKSEHSIVCTYEFDKIKDPNIFEDITKFTHMLIDFICSTSVKVSYKKEAENRRKEYDLRKSKELAEKNAEKVKTEKEEKKANIKKPLTREQAIKLEEKERQENMKKQKRKMFKVLKN